MAPTPPTINAGIVIYRRAGADFEGTWSHQSKDGALARETVCGVAAGDFLGAWPVTVFAPEGGSIFSGTLKSEALGRCIRLSWIESASGATKFAGIGRQLDSDFIVATFEPVP